MLKNFLAIVCFLLGAQVHAAMSAALVPICSKEALRAYAPPPQFFEAHRIIQRSDIIYAPGAKPPGNDSWNLKVGVDRYGKVACYASVDRDGNPVDVHLNDQRREVIKGMKNWRYAPFMLDGHPSPAIVSEWIGEWSKPETPDSLPQVPLANVRVSMEITPCMGACPAYKVDVFGDGRVSFQGNSSVDVTGTHNYTAAIGDVAALVKSIQDMGVWSEREFTGSGLDFSDCLLTVVMGGIVHHSNCADGNAQLAGEMVERIARPYMWIHLSRKTIRQLKSEQFDFRSKASGEILLRAVANRATEDDAAMLELMHLGAPLNAHYDSANVFDAVDESVLEAALQQHRTILVDPLIAAGELNTNGVPDQEKIDFAFRCAVIGGRMELVQKIWKIAGTSPHPSVTYLGHGSSRATSESPQPVSLFLRPPFDRQSRWDSVEILTWLRSLGCNIAATDSNDRSLLHLAAHADNARLVRYLLDVGLKDSDSARDGRSAFSLTHDEDVALLLLGADSDGVLSESRAQSLREYALGNHWSRVLEWVDGHHE